MTKKRKRPWPTTSNLAKRAQKSSCHTNDEGLTALSADCLSTPDVNPTASNVNDKTLSSDLLAIPAEILECIAENLNADDFGNLRLASKAIANRVDYVFANKFFSERCFLLSDKYSLAVLLEISEHELFRKSMRAIWLCPARIKGLPELGPLKDRRQRSLRREVLRDHNRVLQDEKDLHRNELLARLLITILLNFKEVGNLPSINLTPEVPDDAFEPRPLGFTRLQDITGSQQPIQGDDMEHHGNVLIALLVAQYEAEEVHLGSLTCGVPFALFKCNSWEFPSAKLRRLELSMAATIFYVDGEVGSVDDLIKLPYDQWPSRRKIVLGFATLIAGARNLEHLVLHLRPIRSYTAVWNARDPDRSTLRADYFHSIATEFYLDGTPILSESDGMLLPKLRSIELSYQQISLQRLLIFCAQRKDTLESVRLSRIVDMDHRLQHEDVANQIRFAIGADSASRCHVDVSDKCYTGSGWMDLFNW